MLHYLNCASGTLPKGRLITYRELPEGVTYAENFRKRAIMPLLAAFGRQPERLPEAAESLFGATRGDIGDASVCINAFPRVPVTLVIWKGDEEFPAGANILFDAGISDYLSPEDITVLCETITRALANFIKD
jgi:hypothetical protein